ncbi:MAG: proton-conducting transporter membrane subunit, partial [Candidatus Gastranaerophilales bacterium]|nr:proton-conducting transporter membrane subunit [Candidatus Gastranaerophilales bacterium]
MEYFLTGLILIFAGGLISLIFAENYKAKIISIFSFSGTVLTSIPAFKILFTGNVIEKIFYLPEPIGKIPVVIDPLSAFFILVISIMSFLGTVYASGYIKPYLNKNKNISSHFLFLSILICSMLGVVTIQNALFFLIVWEIMSLSSFFLIIFENNKKEVLSAGINYLIYMHICVIFLILGFIMLYLKSGSLEFNSFKSVLESNKIFAETIFILLFIGFGTKAGFVPFHNWLPKAHPAAPSHVSAIMSGVMIKTGIYGILRVLTLIIPSLSISYFILIISALTALFGILYATAQKDIKKLLAYSSIENIGIIGIGIGLGMLGLSYHNNLIATFGFAGAFLHLLNHSIFKEILFFCAGCVYKQTHLKDMEQLGGLAKKMPYTSFLFLIGSISISALPPFNGFISEFLIYMGLLKGLVIKDIYTTVLIVGIIASISFVGAIALLCFTKIFSITFLGVPRSQQSQDVKKEVSFVMLLPVVILALAALLIGLFPQYAVLIVLNPVKYLINNNPALTDLYLPLDLLRYISLSSFAFIAMILAVFGIRRLLLKNKKTDIQNTWGCGYKKINNRMQYS